MTSRNDLNLEQKLNLMRASESGLSYRDLRDKGRGRISNGKWAHNLS
jgi:hypothetical protein